VDRATPRGQTPLTYSLEQAARDFGPASDEERVMILVSDGAESCGGDPAAAARALQAQGFKLKVHTVGFDVDAAARAQLEALSNATGGEYHDARNADALAQSLTRLAQKSLLVAKADEGLGQAIRGGDGYESAVEIKPGQIYRLDHHQRQGQYDYFYVVVQGGVKVSASIETPPQGVKIRGDSFEETIHPYAGIIVQDGSRQKLGEAKIIGDRGAKKTLEGSLSEAGGRLYVLIGSDYDDQHKDGRFSVTVKALPGDAGASRDAGAVEADAVAIKAGSHKGQLEAGGDRVDLFKFTADPQASYRVRVRPSDTKAAIVLKVQDANGEVSKENSPATGEAANLGDLKFLRGGEVFVRVAYTNHAQEWGNQFGLVSTEYGLELVQTGGTPAASAEEKPSGPGIFARLASFLLWSGVPLVFGLIVGGAGGYLLGRRRN
jgi:hypothetical protein